MRSVTLRLEDLRTTILNLGFVGENEHKQFRFDCKKMFEEYPGAAASLTVVPPAGEAYPAVIERDGDYVIWTITDSNLTAEGDGEIQLAFTSGETVAKTYIGRTRTCRALVPTGEIPSGLDDFLTRAGAALTAIPETIDEALAEAKASGEFDGPEGPAGADGQDGQDGQDGYSPTATVVKNGKVATITITDKNGTTTAQISDGESGGDPTAIIDDTAGEGDTNKVWSADKSYDVQQSVLTEITNKQNAPETAGTAGQVLGLNNDLEPEWVDQPGGGGSIDPQDIAQAVSDWCEENITEDPTVVIDKSLLTEGAAADAKAAGDRISVLENMSHPQKTGLITPFAQGTINDTTGAAETSDTTKCHSAKIAVKAGDTVAYSRFDSNIAFASTIFYYDASGSFLSTDTFSSGTTITFSTDGMFAIRCAVNSGGGGTISTAITSAEKSFTGTIDVTPKIVDAVADAVAGAEIQNDNVVLNISNVNVILNSIYKSTGIYGPFLNGRRTDYIPVTPGDTIKYRLWSYFLSPTYQYAVTVFDDDFEAVDHVSGTGAEAGFVSGTYTVPSGASYAMLSWNYDDFRDGWFEINVATLTEKIKDYLHRVNKVQKSILNGKQWCCLGDSLTQGGGTTNKLYRMFIEERTGITAYNFGMSATAITKDTADVTHNMATRFATMYDDVDYVTVFGGTNDHGRSLPIGQWGDSTQLTLYGAMKVLCEGLITKYLGKKIGFLLPCPKCITTDEVTTDYSYPSASFKPYVDCIKDVCARYSIPVLDLYTQSGLHPSIADFRTAYMPDGLHPNNDGQELLSYRIQTFLESL